MQKLLRYTIFKTKWGYFGLVGTTRLSSSKSEYALYRACLPLSMPEKVKSQLLKNLPLLNRESSIKFDKNLFQTLQEQIIAFFEGDYVNFGEDVPVALHGFSLFGSSVLLACRRIRFGQVVTYSSLAKEIGRPAAVRAVGGVLARNPLPLIIPCHRVVRSPRRFASQSEAAGGKLVPAQAGIGGFSAPGGRDLKAKLLKHEQGIESHVKSDSGTATPDERGAKFQNI